MAGTTVSAVAEATTGAPAEGAAARNFCIACLSVRVERPTVVRGPFPDEIDALVNAIRLDDGTMRGFSANGTTYAIDGATMFAMDGDRRDVLAPGPTGSDADCGRWLNGSVRVGGKLYGLVHQEHACDYAAGSTHKSMAAAVSIDLGLTWTDLGTVIAGSYAPTRGAITGEGDCSMVDGHDGYAYAYCLRNSDWQTIVARAPLTDLGPGGWRKFSGGMWSAAGLGGEADAIGFIGPGAGYLSSPARVVAATADHWFGGLRLSFTDDMTDFADLSEPLFPFDEAEWSRPAASELVAYASFVNPEDGSNTIGDRFLLAYTYIPAGEDFASRYLVLQAVALDFHATPVTPQVRLALTRWKRADGAYRTTTGPVAHDLDAFRPDATVAYLLTRPPEGIDSVKLEECARDRAGRVDHVLAPDDTCIDHGYTRLRTAGWAFADDRPGAVAFYLCHDAAALTHFASRAADCEGLGEVENRLGYGLAQ